MPKIFISYRRKDTSYQTTTIYEFLRAKFGRENLFMDVDTIPAGVDFRQYLDDAVRGCDVLLAVIGEEWLVDRDGNRRLDDPRDFVRIEIEAGLRRGIRVIPVLVGDGTMPRPEELPETIQDLAFRNAVQVRPGRDLRRDIHRLIRELESLPSRPIPPPPAKTATPPARPPLQQAGHVITNSIGMKLVLIPAGEFLMGSPDSDQDAHDFEKPQHRVKITRPFYLGVCPVTQEEYKRVMGESPSEFKGDPQRPVESVSWEDAVEFCRRLSEKEGKTYRLPTEAQWEYACRAGSTTKWCFGDSEEELGHYAWYDANSGSTTHPVGQKKPNAWGLHDMHGNVWERCLDWWGGDYYKSSPATDPEGASSGSLRVYRGGSWSRYARNCRSAIRDGYRPWCESINLGFRVSLVLADEEG